MDLKTCYARFGGDYEGVVARLRREEQVEKFLRLFPADESFALLTRAMEAEDWPTAFRAVHSMKGLALNLGLSDLAASSSALTEVLRPGAPTQDPAPLYQAVKADYDKTVAAIGELPKG